MSLTVAYSFRNLLARRVTTTLTAAGMGMTVFVFAAMVMLAEGLEKTLVATGEPANAVILRTSAETDIQSSVERSQAAVVETFPELATDATGAPLAARELAVLITLRKITGSQANVPIRGIGKRSLELRPQVRLVSGRLPRPDTGEVMVGSKVAEGFENARLGQRLNFAQRSWRVVGVFDAGDTGFSSEIWADAEQLMQAFRRQAYSLVLVRLRDPAGGLASLQQRLNNDPRLTLMAMRETAYYEKQSQVMATFLRIMGVALSAIFSIGAVVGAAITMSAAVAGRTQEIGTLRALGFSRWTILRAFLMESALLGLLGGVLGLAMASGLAFIQVSTTNFQTFSELAFSFTLSGRTVGLALGFGVIMGLFGGILPAFRAATMNLMDALRS